jgi:hypothetical protein
VKSCYLLLLRLCCKTLANLEKGLVPHRSRELQVEHRWECKNRQSCWLVPVPALLLPLRTLLLLLLLLLLLVLLL